jgi:hypothetical protein
MPLSAVRPCCQHELHKSLKEGGPMQAVLRQGILRERLADLLTDTFRAQILRVLGFRVQVMEFVSAEATHVTSCCGLNSV